MIFDTERNFKSLNRLSLIMRANLINIQRFLCSYTEQNMKNIDNKTDLKYLIIVMSIFESKGVMD